MPASSSACSRNRLSLEATYFRNRFSDLIVTLGGSLAQLSSYKSDNVANSRAEGGEFAVRAAARPAMCRSAVPTRT